MDKKTKQKSIEEARTALISNALPHIMEEPGLNFPVSFSGSESKPDLHKKMLQDIVEDLENQNPGRRFETYQGYVKWECNPLVDIYEVRKRTGLLRFIPKKINIAQLCGEPGSRNSYKAIIDYRFSLGVIEKHVKRYCDACGKTPSIHFQPTSSEMWEEFYSPLEDLLTGISDGKGDKETAKTWIKHFMNSKDLEGNPVCDGYFWVNYLLSIEIYKRGTFTDSGYHQQELSQKKVAEMLRDSDKRSDKTEKVVAYGTNRVSKELAEKRLPTASAIERGLIAIYHPDLME